MGKFKLGQMVLVHQSGGIKIHDGWFEQIPHDCTKADQHWESRIVGWSEYHQCPLIATIVGNPNFAQWPYFENSLSLLDGENWVFKSQYHPGMKIKFIWNEQIHYPVGTVLEANIEVAHIESGDWYVSFPVPDGWDFKRVVNEKDFIGSIV